MFGRVLFIAAASLFVAASPVAAQADEDSASADAAANDDDGARPGADVEPDAEAAPPGEAAEGTDTASPAPPEEVEAADAEASGDGDADPPGADPPGADDTIDGDADHAFLDGEAPAAPGTDPAWLIAAGAVTGLAALTAVAAVISWTYREGHVSRFNSDECVSATMTREALCYESAYLPGQQAELTTAVAAGIAGAAAITALVLFLVAPSRPPDTDAAGGSCGAGPGVVGLACGARF